jgi:hypothetical protein
MAARHDDHIGPHHYVVTDDYIAINSRIHSDLRAISHLECATIPEVSMLLHVDALPAGAEDACNKKTSNGVAKFPTRHRLRWKMLRESIIEK